MTVLDRKDHLVFHFRLRESETGVALPRGGATVVFVPEIARFGISVCSGRDVFSKKKGRLIAAGRARSKNSFCPYEGETPATMEIVRGLARILAQAEAASILGHRAVEPWDNFLASCLVVPTDGHREHTEEEKKDANDFCDRLDKKRIGI